MKKSRLIPPWSSLLVWQLTAVVLDQWRHDFSGSKHDLFNEVCFLAVTSAAAAIAECVKAGLANIVFVHQHMLLKKEKASVI